MFFLPAKTGVENNRDGKFYRRIHSNRMFRICGWTLLTLAQIGLAAWSLTPSIARAGPGGGCTPDQQVKLSYLKTGNTVRLLYGGKDFYFSIGVPFVCDNHPAVGVQISHFTGGWGAINKQYDADENPAPPYQDRTFYESVELSPGSWYIRARLLKPKAGKWSAWQHFYATAMNAVVHIVSPGSGEIISESAVKLSIAVGMQDPVVVKKVWLDWEFYPNNASNALQNWTQVIPSGAPLSQLPLAPVLKSTTKKPAKGFHTRLANASIPASKLYIHHNRVKACIQDPNVPGARLCSDWTEFWVMHTQAQMLPPVKSAPKLNGVATAAGPSKSTKRLKPQADLTAGPKMARTAKSRVTPPPAGGPAVPLQRLKMSRAPHAAEGRYLPQLSVLSVHTRLAPCTSQRVLTASVRIQNRGGALAAGRGRITVQESGRTRWPGLRLASREMRLPAFAAGQVKSVKIPVNTHDAGLPGNLNGSWHRLAVYLRPQRASAARTGSQAGPYTFQVSFPPAYCRTVRSTTAAPGKAPAATRNGPPARLKSPSSRVHAAGRASVPLPDLIVEKATATPARGCNARQAARIRVRIKNIGAAPFPALPGKQVLFADAGPGLVDNGISLPAMAPGAYVRRELILKTDAAPARLSGKVVSIKLHLNRRKWAPEANFANNTRPLAVKFPAAYCKPTPERHAPAGSRHVAPSSPVSTSTRSPGVQAPGARLKLPARQ